MFLVASETSRVKSIHFLALLANPEKRPENTPGAVTEGGALGACGGTVDVPFAAAAVAAAAVAAPAVAALAVAATAVAAPAVAAPAAAAPADAAPAVTAPAAAAPADAAPAVAAPAVAEAKKFHLCLEIAIGGGRRSSSGRC